MEFARLAEAFFSVGWWPIGCEPAQTFARLGNWVTQVEMAPRLLMREDFDVSEAVQARFEAEGVDVKVGHIAKAFVLENGEHYLLAECDGRCVKIPFDNVLLAIGRAANEQGYGAKELGIRLSPRKTIETNGFQQTNYPNIFAVGDVTGPYQFTHTAAHQAWYAVVNALFGQLKKLKTDYSVIPWATFTDPEVARVGLNKQEAKFLGIAYELSVYGIEDLGRAIADGEAHGFGKVLTKPVRIRFWV